MSVFLTNDDIKNIDSKATQQKILKAVSQAVKDVGNTAEAITIDIYPTNANSKPSHAFDQNSSFYTLIGSVEGPSDLAENHNHYLSKH